LKADNPETNIPVTPAAPPTPPTSKRRYLIGIVVSVLAIVAIGGAVWWQREQERRYKWEPIPMPEKMARVTGKWSPQTLAERLKKSKKIRDEAAFLEAAQQVGMKEVEPGGYWLPEKAGPLELAKIFSQPAPLLKVTFPEGWTAEQMADRLKKSGFPAADDFRLLAYPPTSNTSPLEGRLFPDTYYLPRKDNAKQLSERLQSRYRDVLAKLPGPYAKGYNGVPLTATDVTILASLVERETDVASERPLVAGVLLNRLRIRMRLQCDASVQYARQRAKAMGLLPEGHQERLLFRHIREVEESPYNTYKVYGLPPAPICNPGEPSLQAAAKPRGSEYLFYVMSPKTGRHRFARTFEEHKRNIRLAKIEARQ